MRRMFSEKQIAEMKKNISTLVDSQGHERIIEGDITLSDSVPEGTTKTYGKWYLAVGHLLIVLGLSFANGTEYQNVNTTLATMTLPKWIHDKINILFGTDGVDVKNVNAYNSSGASQAFNNLTLVKATNNVLRITKYGAITFTDDKKCRISYDLLIDNE